MNKYVSIIPARGGSQRLPRKNVRDLIGIPLVAHSILYSHKVLPESEVYVSTDDSEIAAISYRYGAKVINRPAELSDAYTKTDTVIQHAVSELISCGNKFEYVIVLQPTNPLRPEGMMEEACRILETGLYDSLFTVSPFVRKMGRIINNGFKPWNYSFGQRSQDMETLYYENGLLYIAQTELILKGKLMGDTLYPMIVDHIYGTLDIDTERDFREVEYYCRNKV
ncbi:cytidylyltransferase domain-containing protein [Parabacteroides bouchesdurhonensis]|uniref:acylneuraminate cytidylyltransferase family protein n=1 Tax=Parabacteroides bouchesdurhonensis TaxID=1936995 RepID=UPI000C81D8DB|nr:acylneuraminate cytidylyltransferase family protein [Parabacteroides bouchesdurhonensis]